MYLMIEVTHKVFHNEGLTAAKLTENSRDEVTKGGSDRDEEGIG